MIHPKSSKEKKQEQQVSRQSSQNRFRILDLSQADHVNFLCRRLSYLGTVSEQEVEAREEEVARFQEVQEEERQNPDPAQNQNVVTPPT